MAETEAETTNPRMFAALRLLEKVAPPLVYGRQPYWRAPVVLAPEKVFIPSWNWLGLRPIETPATEESVTLDCNGAFMAALGSVPIAHGDLTNTGELDAVALDPRTVLPGYYLIDSFHWPFDGTIVSPLGNTVQLPHGSRIWITAPTLVLLLELMYEGTIASLTINDSYTSERITNFREWNKRLKVARNGLLDNIAKADTEDAIAAAEARYDAFKEGYGAAFSMMLTGEKCHTRRPDWAHHVYGQHAATSWRKAWRFSAGAPLLAMGNTDTLTVLEADLKRAVLSAKPPIKLDPTGRQLGYYKIAKPKTTPAPTAEAVDFVMSDTFEDVL